MKENTKIVRDAVLLGDWQDVQKVKASEITHRDEDSELLDGLVLRGYEMKWGVTNENGEQYARGAFDRFIQSYFVDKGLNMPVDINHEGWQNWRSICGRVLYIETNSVGFYFVIYIPRSYEQFDALKWRLEQGIIQGFSKEGFATDWEEVFKQDGSFDYELIKEISIVSVSLVSTPANGVAFEKMQEIRNSLRYANKIKEEEENAQPLNEMDALFNV